MLDLQNLISVTVEHAKGLRNKLKDASEDVTGLLSKIVLSTGVQMLQNTNSHLIMGEKLGCLNVKELKQLETRLERGISKIRSRKNDIILAETENLQIREVELEHHNAFLCSKVQARNQDFDEFYDFSTEASEVFAPTL